MQTTSSCIKKDVIAQNLKSVEKVKTYKYGHLHRLPNFIITNQAQTTLAITMPATRNQVHPTIASFKASSKVAPQSATVKGTTTKLTASKVQSHTSAVAAVPVQVLYFTTR